MLSNQQQRTETIPIKEEDLSIKSARAPELDAIEIDVVQKQRHLPISKSSIKISGKGLSSTMLSVSQ